MYKKIKKMISLLFQLINMTIYYIISRFYKNNELYKDMWLISERGTEAKDNGYVFFKYLRENHPNINVHYLIDSTFEKDYDKVKKLGNVIEYNSFKHKIAFLLCDKAISSHIGFLEPWSYKLYKLFFDRNDKKKYVILQHGIINHDLSEFYSKKATKANLFITTTNNEYLSISNNNYGYSDNEVVQTGLARFDLLNENINIKNQILLMPTWRKDIVNPSYIKKKYLDDSIFINSNYFKQYNSLLNNEELHKLLRINNYKLIFYPHYEIQQYLKYFNTNSEDIIIASKEDFDVQTLLKESKLLITDYSSVFFDFAYMKKPLLYYHFDKGHYKKGYFNHKVDGFGDIVSTEKDLIEHIDLLFNNNFKVDDKYLDRISDCFKFIDNKNCERIYSEIIKLNKK